MDIRGTNLQGINIIDQYRVPNAPVIGTATLASATSVTISFTAPSFNGNQPITSYTAVSTPGNLTATVTQSGSGSITVTGLTTGTSYTFVVYATTIIGNSSNSSASNSITPVGVPGTPIIGTVTTSNMTATVPFTAPASNGGTPIISYTAISSPGGYTGTVTQSGSGSITVSLAASGTYTFTVYATNSVGNSPSSSVSNSVVVTSLIAAATGGTITTSGNYKVHVFTSSGTFSITSGLGDVDILVLGGGGAGAGNGGNTTTGGGGAGGLIWTTVSNVGVGSYTATVGAGGSGALGSAPRTGNSGGNSSFMSNIAGGGYGGRYGAGGNQGTINGSAGNTGFAGNSGGGGGAGAASTNKDGGAPQTISVLNGITGYNNTGVFGGGGAGYTTDFVTDFFGTASGGGGSNADGVVNTGGGGSSQLWNNVSAFSGGSGIVVVRYKFQ